MMITNDFGNDTSRAHYGDVTGKMVHGNGTGRWSSQRGHEIDDGRLRPIPNGLDYRNQSQHHQQQLLCQQQQQRHLATIYQNTPRSVVMKISTHRDHAAFVSNCTAAPAASVTFGQVYFAGAIQAPGVGSHKEFGHRYIGDGGFRNRRIAEVAQRAPGLATAWHSELDRHSASTSSGELLGARSVHMIVPNVKPISNYNALMTLGPCYNRSLRANTKNSVTFIHIKLDKQLSLTLIIDHKRRIHSSV